ncbi:MAG TPA: FAD-dependent oxidoreductase [Methylomusa anaerophila]|uniref:NAD-dependent dihydropyrimidine dehydrogenase subunit PreT n=1 Tax=Methylomusa anaerophila TaxID=1930071 RepID=A0A348AHQ0_9FIRM|nr:FAD-dependent oxidoreductase [Methylomusa anaerophila]BBB90598.1 NAD-dependent dihydropyrimidine dehydrogenase subunit PreT [Methylomusa anaerophila]HML88795.1 FAD-dependent oxidoreductase [Methylomusa anaerophila]
MFKINTLDGNNRMSTQDLLQAIQEALAQGETEFYIEASGQHDIGGPLWHPEGKTLKFVVTNPGQRVGSMCLPGTEIIVEGTASADVGWLNAGGKIVVKGDGGDTAAHCAAAGAIYVGGRAGTRSGSLMKHDPLYDPPEFWVLKNCGSFSFEFMGGGIAVVCGYDSEQFASVLGDRSCVGMVGGVLYFRGRASGISRKDTKILTLDAGDIAYLDRQMDDFLASIGRPELRNELSRWEEWHKVVPLTYDERPKKANTNIFAFRHESWIPGGIFSDVYADDFQVIGLVTTDKYRRQVPVWENARYSAPCEFNCTASIPSQLRFNLLREGRIEEAYRLVLEYTPFPGSVCGAVCPNLCMDECTRKNIDISAQIGMLGRYSAAVEMPRPANKTGKRIAVIGGGAAGLTAAWQLARMGHGVTVFEADAKMGGKMEQVIPRSRLPQATLTAEIDRIAAMGVSFRTGYKIDQDKFREIKEEYQAVVVATGSHVPRVINWPGQERLVRGLEFLKAINKGERPTVGKQVIVIGCGNSGMDVAVGAYALGAEQVTCIDVQKPAAFPNEIDHVKKLGGEILWPVFAREITAAGVITQEGTLIRGDTVIIAIGESPDLSFLPAEIAVERGCLKPGDDYQVAKGIFTAGDTIRPGRLVDAIGAGRQAALAANAYLNNEVYQVEQKTKIPSERLSTAYFKKCHTCDLPDANNDYTRCISCGTCRDCHMCLQSCPENAISRVNNDGAWEYVSDAAKCIGCGICAGICPCGIWAMTPNQAPLS